MSESKTPRWSLPTIVGLSVAVQLTFIWGATWVWEKAQPKSGTKKPSLRALSISSKNSSLTVGERLAPMIKGTYADDSEATLSSGVELHSNNSAIASVNDRGEIQAHKQGTVTIVAKIEGASSPPLNITVKPIETAAQSPDPAPSKASSQEQKKAAEAKFNDSFILGKLYLERGDLEKAATEFAKAKAIEPGNKELAELLAKIGKAKSAPGAR